jgi:hypothetical protein
MHSILLSNILDYEYQLPVAKALKHVQCVALNGRLQPAMVRSIAPVSVAT